MTLDFIENSPPPVLKSGDMTLDFIENYCKKYFCTAHYLIARDAKN